MLYFKVVSYHVDVQVWWLVAGCSHTTHNASLAFVRSLAGQFFPCTQFPKINYVRGKVNSTSRFKKSLKSWISTSATRLLRMGVGESYSSVPEPDFEQKLKMYENFMPKANVFEQGIKGVICDNSDHEKTFSVSQSAGYCILSYFQSKPLTHCWF